MCIRDSPFRAPWRETRTAEASRQDGRTRALRHAFEGQCSPPHASGILGRSSTEGRTLMRPLLAIALLAAPMAAQAAGPPRPRPDADPALARLAWEMQVQVI